MQVLALSKPQTQSRTRLFVALAAAFALAASFAMAKVTRAADAPAAGGATLTGKVVDADGKGVEGARVAVIEPKHRNHQAPAAEGDRKEHPKPVAEGTTGADGTYTITGVPEGKFAVVAHKKGAGMGHSKAIEVSGTGTITVPDITLEKGRHEKPNHNAPATQPA